MQPVAHVDLEPTGARGDRAFHVRTRYGRVALSTRHGTLHQVVPQVDGDRLALRFPDGTVAAGTVVPGREVRTALYDGRTIAGRVVEGPWSAALSAHLGRDVELVARDPAERAGDDAPVTLLARPSMLAVDPGLDERRFRMTLTVDGTDPWEEEAWEGRLLHAGEAALRVVGPCVRCAVVTHHPETGATDQPVLRQLRRARDGLQAPGPARPPAQRSSALGLLLEVERPGRVAVGDAVAVA